MEAVFENGIRHEHEIKKVERFYALDFDRCLGNTEKLYKLLVQSLGEVYDQDAVHVLKAVREDVEASGGSFDVMDHLARLGYDVDEVVRHFLDAEVDTDTLYEPGAREFLDALSKSGLPFAIVTYGGSEWQLAKLARMNMLHIPHLILSKSRKGSIISGWQNDEGDFTIPEDLYGPMFASNIILVDDKAQAFDELPDSSRGYLIQHPLKLELYGPEDASSLPHNVRTVYSFVEIADSEDLHLNVA